MKTNQEVINAINKLIQTNYARERSYYESYEKVDDNVNNVRAAFDRFASDSKKYIDQLSALVQSRGGDPETDSSFGEDIYRSWLNFRSALGGNTVESLLKGCDLGENDVLKDYDNFLEDTESFTAVEMATVSEQRVAIRAAQLVIQGLRKLIDIEYEVENRIADAIENAEDETE